MVEETEFPPILYKIADNFLWAYAFAVVHPGSPDVAIYTSVQSAEPIIIYGSKLGQYFTDPIKGYERLERLLEYQLQLVRGNLESLKNSKDV